MQSRHEIETELEKRLSNHKAAIKRLSDQAEDANDEAKVIALKKIDELKQIVAVAESRLQELKTANDDTWHQTKDIAEEFWGSLGRELKAYDPTAK